MSGGGADMESPRYHLDGVVHARDERENFDGPLDLILSLLSKNKMEIGEIQISLILEQYLEWMNRRKELDLEVASEFVTMAAHLVYIKTRMLLSLQDEEAGGELEQLIASLEERQRSEHYLRIRAVTDELNRRYAVGRDYLSKPPEPIPTIGQYRYQHAPEDLPNALQRMLRRSEQRQPPTFTAFEGIVGREPYPVPQKSSEILLGLLRTGFTTFRSLFQRSRSRSEVVATFLAVLELCRSRCIALLGSGADCTVTRLEENAEMAADSLQGGEETEGKNGEMWNRET